MIFLSIIAGIILSCVLSRQTVRNESETIVGYGLEQWQYGLILCFVVLLLVYIVLGYIRIVREIEKRMG